MRRLGFSMVMLTMFLLTGYGYESHAQPSNSIGYRSGNKEIDGTKAGPAGYEYLPGDANMHNGAWPPRVIGSDVTYLVSYFRGSECCPPCLLGGFYCSADANGSCLVLGSDVTYLINYMRGGAGPQFCPDFEPLWLDVSDLPPDPPAGWPNCE